MAIATLLLLSGSCIGCYSSKYLVSSNQSKKKVFPVDSFVKIYRIVKVVNCTPIKGSKCAEGTEFTSSGSGVIIHSSSDGSVVLTAGHMCDIGFNKEAMLVSNVVKSIELVTIKNKIFRAKVINKKVKKGTDLCILYSGTMVDQNYSKISNSAPRVGDLAYNIAAPAGIFHPPAVPILDGYYSGYMTDNDSDMYTIPAVGGSSGSPIYNENFEIIGSIYAAATTYSHMSISTTYKNMLKFINESVKIMKNAKKRTRKDTKKKSTLYWF
jgi:hypothetical protein